jgi:PAS domain S-box-containing protein
MPVAAASLTVTRVMRKLQRALSTLGARATSEATIRSRAEALLAQAADMPVALLIANNSGRYIDVNDHATRLTGYSRAELLRLSVWDLTPTPVAAAGRRMWREFLDAGQMAGTYPLCRKDRRQVVADFRAWANILPGVHVSALATPVLVASVRGRGARRSPRRRRRRD